MPCFIYIFVIIVIFFQRRRLHQMRKLVSHSFCLYEQINLQSLATAHIWKDSFLSVHVYLPTITDRWSFHICLLQSLATPHIWKDSFPSIYVYLPAIRDRWSYHMCMSTLNPSYINPHKHAHDNITCSCL